MRTAHARWLGLAVTGLRALTALGALAGVTLAVLSLLLGEPEAEAGLRPWLWLSVGLACLLLRVAAEPPAGHRGGDVGVRKDRSPR